MEKLNSLNLEDLPRQDKFSFELKRHPTTRFDSSTLKTIPFLKVTHGNRNNDSSTLPAGDSLVTDGERRETYPKFILEHGMNRE